MMSRLEKIGLLSLLDAKAQHHAEAHAKHRENSQMQEQSAAYRDSQSHDSRYHEGIALGLEKAIQEVKKIPTGA
ncbi:MAG: hypothetical protein K5880_14565 [Hydrogenophaga sp.]|uniref:hypothetical protein n=1 Tax=Hydrogenophaga sp. TaxID=1904254 RepID=UPI002636D8A8|nr:hypothetical protein [Hydrogenophaga sp.]MCV0439841.1 hypothetical protein [Hydrogenophaga sp.]